MSFLRAASRTSTFLRPTFTARRTSPLFARWISDALRSRLDKDVKSKDVVLFMKGTPDQPMCGFSRAAVQIMTVQGVDFSEKVQAFNVLEDEELRQGIKEYSEWPTIPQVYIKGEFIGGCDVLLNMHQSGDLEDLLVKHNIVPEEEVVEEKK
ncbi:thioredoxin-like protein [Radiomyces spectabilis]|uniref:thioredoxin-like protein n=1 Tax=Radiomyces spectabilis TaxID=64574 RepID=UPI002220EA3B|nr:thioredoxin-like protein [Radiomyces spectabilis]KAI8384990.1 thioredoxin-like protein [Radiomyces spectabilis]